MDCWTRVGLDRTGDLFSRGSDQVCLKAEPDALPWALPHLVWGIRRAIDRKHSEYDVTGERKQTSRARNVYEVASPYGTRIPKLISEVGRRTFESLSGETLVYQPWLDGFGFVYREQDRRGIHLLTESDLDVMEFDRANIVSSSNYALFHSGTKSRSCDVGREFVSSDGRACGIVALFPDFIYDDAADTTRVQIESEDRVIVGADLGPSDPTSWFPATIEVNLDGLRPMRPYSVALDFTVDFV